MATSPYPENPKNLTVANLDAWKKAGATIEPTTNSGLQITTSKIINENEMPNLIGSVKFSAKDAFKSSLEVNEEYSSDELDRVVDSVILHIKELAETGEMTAAINVSNFNDGMTRALIKELKQRGFRVKRDHESGYGLSVSWERRVDWKTIGAGAVIALILLIAPVGFYVTAKANQPVAPIQVEKTK